MRLCVHITIPNSCHCDQNVPHGSSDVLKEVVSLDLLLKDSNGVAQNQKSGSNSCYQNFVRVLLHDGFNSESIVSITSIDTTDSLGSGIRVETHAD